MIVKYRRDLWKLLQGIPGSTAEIGVAEGLFSRDILNWPTDRLHYLVDGWTTIPGQKGDASQSQAWHDQNLWNARALVKPFGNRAVFLQGKSVEMADWVPVSSLALLYIDADHSYEGVLADLRAWAPNVVPGGIIALHDYEMAQYGVKKAVQVYCREKSIKTIYLMAEDAVKDAGAYFYAN